MSLHNPDKAAQNEFVYEQAVFCYRGGKRLAKQRLTVVEQEAVV